MDDAVVLVAGAAAAAAYWWWLRQRNPALHSFTDVVSRLFGGPHEQETQAPSTAQQERPLSQAQTALVPLWVIPPAGLVYVATFTAAEVSNGLPVLLLARMAWQESRFNVNAVSPRGAVGIMQFMPLTAQDFGLDPTNPIASIWAAGRYMRQLGDRFGDWRTALAAYNWGQGNVASHPQDMPQETIDYVAAIAGDLKL